MKRTIPFELFGANQYLVFDMMKLATFERAMGRSISTIVASGEFGIDAILKGLPIAMNQHYFNKPPEFWAELIEKHFDNGGSIEDIAVPLIRAILVSGVLGSDVRERVIAQMEAEAKVKDVTEKADSEAAELGEKTKRRKA